MPESEQTNLERLRGVGHHDFPHVLDELAHVFPHLAPVEDERVRHRAERLLGHVVGGGAGLLLVLTLRWKVGTRRSLLMVFSTQLPA